jgi:hypothetical protein
MNLVEGGNEMERDALLSRDALILKIAGGLVGACFINENKNVSYAIWGLSWGYSFRLDFAAFKARRQASWHLQQGFSPSTIFDIEPDAAGDGPRGPVEPVGIQVEQRPKWEPSKP